MCRKVIKAKKNNEKKIEVWGDGMQTRTFLYIDDCIEGTLRLFESDYTEPVNIGSDEQVSINKMIEIACNTLTNSNINFSSPRFGILRIEGFK